MWKGGAVLAFFNQNFDFLLRVKKSNQDLVKNPRSVPPLLLSSWSITEYCFLKTTVTVLYLDTN